MTSLFPSNRCNLPLAVHEHVSRRRFDKVMSSGYSCSYIYSKGLTFFQGQCLRTGYCQNFGSYRTIRSSMANAGTDPDDSDDETEEKEPLKGENGGVNGEILREDLERMIGANDSAFSGIDLATLIRKKYGRSYDVQLIKKEFMGRNFLALNVMWKYVEQRSFPLTEEEYLLRLDDVANNLKCWGAVSHIRNSLSKLKERPRIGKAVSIFIDMDESGGRSNEWIYK